MFTRAIYFHLNRQPGYALNPGPSVQILPYFEDEVLEHMKTHQAIGLMSPSTKKRDSIDDIDDEFGDEEYILIRPERIPVPLGRTKPKFRGWVVSESGELSEEPTHRHFKTTKSALEYAHTISK
jgi:hypothetical protein